MRRLGLPKPSTVGVQLLARSVYEVGRRVAVREKRFGRSPPDLLVIGDVNANPYAIPLSKAGDSPVFFAFHGMGSWTFEEVAPSLESFLDDIVQQLP